MFSAHPNIISIATKCSELFFQVIEILQDSGSQSPTEDDELLDLRNELENAGQNTKSPAASPMKRNPVNATSSGRLQKPSRDQWKEVV